MARSFATTGHFTSLGRNTLIFPVGYPLLITPAFLIGEQTPFLVITVIHALLAAVYLAGIYVWVRRYAPKAALPIALIALGNTVVLAIFRRPLSEVSFLPVMIWLCNALDQLDSPQRFCEAPSGPSPQKARWTTVLPASLLLTCLAMIRPTGIIFAAGFALQLLLAVRQNRITFRRGYAVPWRKRARDRHPSCVSDP